MFIDTAKARVIAGNGGRGAVSFRREIYVDKGGPDGGDGGDGGSVIFIADNDIDTLVDFRYKPELKAASGEAGAKRRRHGKKGPDLVIKVPVGTSVYKDDRLLMDFVELGQEAVVAKGGKGGFGNAHFTTSTRQTPRVAEKGEPGEEFEITLELKLLADVGLIGLPNAGKSTFLSVVSNAKPEIADYPFTTLKPQLGVVDIDDSSLLIADIPGLIEGAAEGKGLGHQFLRHVERTGVLLHLIDAYSEDIVKDYKIIRAELAAYSEELIKRPEIIAITKTEGLDDEMKADLIAQLQSAAGEESSILAISSQAHQNLTTVIRELKMVVDQERQKQTLVEKTEPELPVFSLDSDEDAWQVDKIDDNTFKITGRKIEKFAIKTDFENYHGRQRLRDIMRKMGITHELLRQGATSESQIVFSDEQALTLDEI